MAGNAKNDKKEILKKTTATVLSLRVLVGGFILYLAYQIAQGLGDTKGKDTIILGFFAGLFTLAGLAIVLICGYKLIKKDYYDPMNENQPEDIVDIDEKEDKDDKSSDDNE